MPQFRFRVASVADEGNLRGQAMVRVIARAVAGEAFTSDEPLGEGVTPCDPVGEINVLVSESYARERGLVRGALIDPALHLVE